MAGEVLVRFANKSAAAIQATTRLVSADRTREIAAGWHRVHSAVLPTEQMLRALAARPDVVAIQPNYIVHTTRIPNDPQFPQLWGLKNGSTGADIHATNAWDISTGSASLVVGIVDTGIDYNHPDLAANMWSAPAQFNVTFGSQTITCPAGSHGFNAITMSCDPMDDNNHGTHTAGTVGAVGNNNVGVVGVNWTTRLMGLKFLDSGGSGNSADAINAIDFALQAKAVFGASANVRVLSNSWGGGGADGSLLTEIQKAQTANVLFVAAAGNSASNNDGVPFYPASFATPTNNIVAVAASDSTDHIASFSNYGATSVDLAAPGVGIVSTIRNGGYGSFSGTSMATPHVSGAAALVLSSCALTTAELKATIRNAVDVLPAFTGIVSTNGRLNVDRAIRSCGNGAPSVSLTAPADGAQFSAGATITVTATASDSDGIRQVDFFANGSPIGTATTSPYTIQWPSVGAGGYSLTAMATDNLGATATSTAIGITVNPPAGQLNVALASNGGTAVASSTLSSGYAPGGTINGDRKGLNWGGGNGGWADGTPGTFPDWLEVDFNGPKTLTEVDVFSVQDNYQAPSNPTPGMTFSLYGLTDFQVQYWAGQWVTLPGGAVSGNNLVWWRLTFAPITTSKIRVLVVNALNTWSRVTEVEAYGTANSNTPPAVSLTAPADGALFSAGATITVTATASDSDGIRQVDFFANGSPIGTATTNPYTIQWPNVGAGGYSLTAVATDNLGATATSTAVGITVNPPTGQLNVALASNGGTAVASSTLSSGYAPSGTINGDRKGLNWGGGGGWADGTPGNFPDWLEVDFNGPKTLTEVDVFSVQDNYQAPSDPTPGMTFSLYGLTDFQVQYWAGQWVTLPGGAVSGNNLIWWRLTFAPITASKIRVLVVNALNTWSRVAEVEAYGTASSNTPPTVSLTAPADGAQFSAGATITVTATASDSDGIRQVDFFANGSPIGTATTNPYTIQWPSVGAGSYSLTAMATDNLGATATSTAIGITVNPPTGQLNMALASNGGTAVASSTLSSGYAAAGAINGDRKGLNWGGGNGGWADGTPDNFPDWLEVDFNGPKTLTEVDVFSVQDNYQAPSNPTTGMTFSLYGLTDFQVQYWAGQWVTLPGGAVSGNNRVWWQLTFAPVTTSKIRVLVVNALNTWSRITEIEAYGTASTSVSSTNAARPPDE